MQSPSAHITVHGSKDKMIGAAPIAINQLQFESAPTTTIAAAASSKPRRPPNHRFRKLGWASRGASTIGATAFRLVIVSMTCILCWLAPWLIEAAQLAFRAASTDEFAERSRMVTSWRRRPSIWSG
jgi:hypothetical protein